MLQKLELGGVANGIYLMHIFNNNFDVQEKLIVK